MKYFLFPESFFTAPFAVIGGLFKSLAAAVQGVVPFGGKGIRR